MNLEDFIRQMEEDSVQWFPNGRDLVTLTLGLCGEAGEVADLVKKMRRGSIDLTDATAQLHEELIDVFHYWCLLVSGLGVDVESIYRRKREINVDRFGTDPKH